MYYHKMESVTLVFLDCQEMPAIKDHQIHLILPLPNLKQIDFLFV